MELKTKVEAADGKQEILITREFDLPVHLLFKAYTEPELVEKWMGNKVLKLESRTHGSYEFETRDPQDNVVFRASGTIHEYRQNEKITRTFEMENTPFEAQLEFLEFKPMASDKSTLTMHIVFRSLALRDQLLKMPFAQGLSMAHNRLENLLSNLK